MNHDLLYKISLFLNDYADFVNFYDSLENSFDKNKIIDGYFEIRNVTIIDNSSSLSFKKLHSRPWTKINKYGKNSYVLSIPKTEKLANIYELLNNRKTFKYVDMSLNF